MRPSRSASSIETPQGDPPVRLASDSKNSLAAFGKSSTPSAPLVVLLMAGLWFSLQVQRFSLASYVGASTMMLDLGITATAAGFLASVYYPMYGLMQIPSGILADQGSPKHNILIGSFISVCAGLVFAFSPNLEIATGARIVVGLSAGMLWMSQLKLLSLLSESGPPKRRYPRRLSIVMAIGSAGTIVGVGVLPAILTLTSWREVSVAITLPAFIVALALFVVPLPKIEMRPARVVFSGAMAALAKVPSVIGRLEFWPMALTAMIWMGVQFAILTWLPRYARDVLDMPPTLVGLMPALVPLGAIIGNILFGQLQSHNPRLALPTFFTACILYTAMAILLASGWVSALGGPWLLILAVLLGILSGCFFIALAWAGAQVEPSLMATATGTMNALGFLPAFILPWLMGAVMDAVDKPSSPAWRYTNNAYSTAFAMDTVILVMALIGAAAIKLVVDRRHRLLERQTRLAAETKESEGSISGKIRYDNLD